MEVKLSEVKQGESFKWGGNEYTRLDDPSIRPVVVLAHHGQSWFPNGDYEVIVDRKVVFSEIPVGGKFKYESFVCTKLQEWGYAVDGKYNLLFFAPSMQVEPL